jgi:sarcosine oxidase, subunit alpha
LRITGHPILPETAKDEVRFTFDGRPYVGRDGEPVAAALLAAGVRVLRRSPVAQEPRGIYCGIGHCYECRVWLNGDTLVRACVTPVREGDAFSSERDAR